MAEEITGRAGVILQAVVVAAERYLAAADWQAATDEVLKSLGQATEASRVHVYGVRPGDDDDFLCTLMHEWAAPGVAPVIDDPLEHDFPLIAGGYGRWIGILGEGQLLQATRSELPESERGFAESEGILSLLVVPIFVEGRWWGWIGVDETQAERRWTQGETDALRSAAGALGAAIHRERMEKQRLNAESKYRALVEQLPSVTYIASADPSNATLYISPQVQDLLGYSPSDWIKTRNLWQKLLHADDQDRVMEATTQHNETGEPLSIEYRMKSRWGKDLWIHEEATLVPGTDGRPAYWQGVMIDITEKMAAEEKVQEAEARYKALVEHMPAAVYIDPLEPGPVMYMSSQIEKMTGYPAEEWLATQLWESLIHPDDRERVARANEAADRAGDRFSFEYRLIAKDGSVVWIHDESAVVFGPVDKPLYWQGVLIDITELKDVGEKAHEAEERYKAVVEHMPAVAYIDAFDERGTTVYISPQIEQLLGYTAAEWTADPDLWEKVLHPEDRDRVLALDRETDDDFKPFDMQYRTIARDGREVFIDDHCVVVRDESGNPIYWHGVMFDITETRKAQDLAWALEMERSTTRRLRELDQMKNTFLTAVSHDFRSPLAAVLGLALTMERDDMELSSTEVRDLSGRIASQARRLDRLVADMLDLEKLSSGEVRAEREPTDVGALLSRVLKEADFLHSHSVHLDNASVSASVDPVKLERIVVNLLANAASHTPDGTDIWVKATNEGAGLVLVVEDSGPGVSDEDKETIFEPFRRGGASSSPGVGVGLSLVARFAEIHEGRAWVSDRAGGGASFCVLLP